MINFVRKKLSRVLLTILTVIVALIMIIVTYLTAFYQQRNMIKEMITYGDELANVIMNDIQYQMSAGEKEVIKKKLEELRKIMNEVDVYICNDEQQVVFASSEEEVGTFVTDSIIDKKFEIKLTETFSAGREATLSFEDKTDLNRFLFHVNIIPNQKDCYRCHGASKKILGGVIVRMDTGRTYSAITRLRNNNILISAIGICAIIGLTYTILSKLVTQPVGILAKNMEELPEKIEAGDHSVITNANIQRQDEIGNLLVTFNQMVNNLMSKDAVIKEAYQELAAANEELESFAYSVSHDLRAPLRNIDGFSSILLSEYADRIDEQGKHYLKRIKNGMARMSNLIDDMLSFSRAGRVDLQLLPTDANTLMDKALYDFSEEIKTKNILINVDKLPVIICDPVMMQDVFLNLLSNSIKYSRTVEKPEISVGFDETQKIIYFKDNGIGFDLKYHDKIFQVFQRLNLAEEYEGTGIGLAIVKRVIERNHGTIWARSKPGKGATFYIKIPLKA